MTLDGFQFIFWWEWAHRLSGRLIGVVFFLPYVWFLLRGHLRGALAARCSASSSSAACRARWAGTWSRADWSTIRASRNTGSPRTSVWPSCSSA
jgi:cytochrome c oxidase assembly protein subunit 15